MINLDQRYHDYLAGEKKFRIDGLEEKVTGYGYHCDGSDILGYYVATENHKLYYDKEGSFEKKRTLAELSTIG